MINQAKPNTSLLNNNKISFGETWATITTDWASEVRTWEAVSKLIANSNKVSSSISNQVKPV